MSLRSNSLQYEIKQKSSITEWSQNIAIPDFFGRPVSADTVNEYKISQFCDTWMWWNWRYRYYLHSCSFSALSSECGEIKHVGRYSYYIHSCRLSALSEIIKPRYLLSIDRVREEFSVKKTRTANNFRFADFPVCLLTRRILLPSRPAIGWWKVSKPW